MAFVKVNKKLKSLTQICFGCPDEWEGELEDGSYIFIKYRYERLGYGIGKTPEEAVEDWFKHENEMKVKGASMETDEMLKYLGLEWEGENGILTGN